MLRIDIFSILGLQIWKRGLKSQKDTKITNIWKKTQSKTHSARKGALSAKTSTDAMLSEEEVRKARIQAPMLSASTEAQVHSNNYKKRIKSRKKDTPSLKSTKLPVYPRGSWHQVVQRNILGWKHNISCLIIDVSFYFPDWLQNKRTDIMKIANYKLKKCSQVTTLGAWRLTEQCLGYDPDLFHFFLL